MILSHRCGAVLVSMGEEGSRVFTRAFPAYVPAYQVKAVDTTGACDAFLGAVLFGLCQLDCPRLDAVILNAWQGLLTFGNAAGGLAKRKRGGIPALPERWQIQELQHQAR